MMRIITGTARGVKLETLDGETTRPTSERAKEAVFSMLQFDIENRSVLDLFGGSGQLALEALSRGAEKAFISDSDQSACEVIKRNAKKTKLFDRTRVVCSDCRAVIRNLSGREKFGLIFLDPPYKSGLVPEMLERLEKYGLVAEGGLIVCESDAEQPFSLPGYELKKHAKYGRAYVTVLRKQCSE